jgi:hypothetical protein
MLESINLQSQLELVNIKRIHYLKISVIIFLVVATPILIYTVRGIIKDITFSLGGIFDGFYAVIIAFCLIGVLGGLPGIFLNEFYKTYFKEQYLGLWLKNNSKALSFNIIENNVFSDFIKSQIFPKPVSAITIPNGLLYEYDPITVSLIQINARSYEAGSSQKKNQINSSDIKAVVFSGTFIKGILKKNSPLKHYLLIVPKISDTATSVQIEFLPMMENTDVFSLIKSTAKEITSEQKKHNLSDTDPSKKIVTVDKSLLPLPLLLTRNLEDKCLTGNAEFDSLFSVLSDSKEFVSSISKTKLLSDISAMNKAFSKNVYFSFIDNTIYLAIDDSYYLLLPTFFTPAEKIHGRLTKDISKINTMVDYTLKISKYFE